MPYYLQMAGFVKLFTGPMFSGKSSLLFSEIDKAIIAKIPVCLVRPKVDTRDFLIHGKKETGTCDVYSVDDLSQVPYDQYDIICVDEGHFLKSLEECFLWANNGKKVFIAVLNGDRFQKEWETVRRIIPLVDDITFLKAVCSRCGSYEAAFSYKEGDANTGQLNIGGSAEKYTALCRDCLNEMKDKAFIDTQSPRLTGIE